MALIGWFVFFWFIFVQLPLAYAEVCENYPDSNAPIFASVHEKNADDYMAKASMFLSIEE